VKIATAITFAHEAAAARAQDAYAVEQDQVVRRVDAARTFWITTIDCSACMERANTRGTVGATGVVVALETVSKMTADITDDRALAATSVSFDHLADAARGSLSSSTNRLIQGLFLAKPAVRSDRRRRCRRFHIWTMTGPACGSSQPQERLFIPAAR
jgi:hypothetical protein